MRGDRPGGVEPGLPLPWVCRRVGDEHGVIVRPGAPPEIVGVLADRWPAGQEVTR